MAVQLNDAPRVDRTWAEHQMLEHIKRALRVTVGWQQAPTSPVWRHATICFALKSFQRHLERLMRIEEEGGYLSPVADSKPNMFPRVAQLRNEHEQFRRRIQSLLPELDRVSRSSEPPRAGSSQTRLAHLYYEVEHLLDDVERHDREEIDLLQESLLFDEGGEG